MINERVNYFEYLGLRPDASVDEIKNAIQEKEIMFIRDGIDKQSISKTMINETLRNIEREKYLEILRQQDAVDSITLNKIEYDQSIDNLDIDEVKEINCWNCGTKYETGLFYNDSCPNCSAEASARNFNQEIAKLEKQILENGTREQLMFAVELLIKKYASKPDYKAHQVLNHIREQIAKLETLDNIHDKINVLLDSLEQKYNKKLIFTAYKEYEKNKDIIENEGIKYDPRVVNVVNKYYECEQYLSIIKEASKKKDYDILFANIKKLKFQTIDCYEIDEIMNENPIPSVTNLSIIENNHRIYLSWVYNISGVYFSIHKIVGDAEYNVVDEIYDNSFEYEEPLNGVEIKYFVCAHFENINSINNPMVTIKILDNVKDLIELKVSETIAFSWIAPSDCEILVIKKENEVPVNWQDGSIITEVSKTGFVDRDVIKGKSYGYRIKCIYAFDGAKFESKEINIHPVFPHYDFLPMSIIKNEIDYEENVWKLQYHGIKIGEPILFKHSKKMNIDVNKIYCLEELSKLGLCLCDFHLKNNEILTSLEYERVYYFYPAVQYENKLYINSPIEIILNGYIHNIRINNIGGSNKTIEVLFNWGVKSKQIVLIDNENDYLETYENVMDAVYKFKDENEESDRIILNLKDRLNHFISIFEVDEDGFSRLIKKLEPLTKNNINLYYDFKFKKNKIITTIYFEQHCRINDIYLCKMYSNGKTEELFGPLEVVTKKSFFKGIIATFEYESEYIDSDSSYVLMFNKNSQSKMYNINGKFSLLVLKEKNNE